MRNRIFSICHSHIANNQLKGDRKLEIINKRIKRFCCGVTGLHFTRDNLAILLDNELKFGAVTLFIVIKRITVLDKCFSNKILIDATLGKAL